MTVTKTLTFTRVFQAAPGRVAAALTNPDARMTWGPPDAETVVVIEAQPAPAPGVREVSSCGPADNPYVTVLTDWVEITPLRISYAETLMAEGEAFASSLGIFDMEAVDDQTRVNVTVFVASFAGDDVLPEVEGGWTHAIDSLGQFLQSPAH